MPNSSSTNYPTALDTLPSEPSSSDRSDAAIIAIQQKLGICNTLTADGAIPVTYGGDYVITKAGVCALTLAAPSYNGQIITVTSFSANAHTITTVDLIHDGTTGTHDLATFAAFQGASITLMGYSGKWLTLGTVAVTITT